jgi:Papain family cysteine protease
VKHQGKCGSCLAFATMGAIETCFRRITGRFGDYSEQELIDCGFGHKGANGCVDAELDSYFDWILENNVYLTGEVQYPYLYTQPKLTCPYDMPPEEELGATVTDYFITNKGSETELMELVVSHGAIISTLAAYEEFKAYRGGLFDKCPPGLKDNHAVLVVGYNTTDEGEDYWLIKNSWGVGWGEDGFMRIKRGIEMCNIGRSLAGVECAEINDDEVEYPTSEENPDLDKSDENTLDEPKGPKNTCTDTSSNCNTFDKSFCDLPKGIAPHCSKYCNLC